MRDAPPPAGPPAVPEPVPGPPAWPLMRNNIPREDLDALVAYLGREDPPLTQAGEVRAFEEEWSRWLGVRHSVFVNSGSSANLLTLAALRHTGGPGEVVVPTLTWVSDIAAVLQSGFTPVFVDIDPGTLGMRAEEVLARVGPLTRAVFLTHVLGFNALTDGLLEGLREKGVPLVEDACESHGATFRGRKVGTFGVASNFSFYYAHHMSTIEGGMICTDDEGFAEMIRMLRSHGMVREARSEAIRRGYRERHPDLNPDFIFAYPAYNVRSTELQAVLGRSQLRRLDQAIALRTRRLALFLSHLDPSKYRTGFALEGSSSYAFPLVLRRPDDILCRNVMEELRRRGIEFRRGASGGGNQLRQPYLSGVRAGLDLAGFPNVEHVHFYGFYIGNYPDLAEEDVIGLCSILNAVPGADR